MVGRSWREFCSLVRREWARGKREIMAQFKTRTSRNRRVRHPPASGPPARPLVRCATSARICFSCGQECGTLCLSMNTVSLQEAVKEIARTGKRAADWDGAEPYLLIVGAGVSYPSVPTAADIQKHCEREAGVLGQVLTRFKGHPLSIRYSYWFLKAYPSAIEQQRYLQALIENKPITWQISVLRIFLYRAMVAKS